MDVEEKSPCFQQVTSSEPLLKVLRQRIPQAAHIFNMVQMWSSFPTEMSFYKIVDQDEGQENPWILAKYEREDTGQQFGISGPNNLKSVSEPIRTAFRTLNPDIINWNRQFEFIGLEAPVTELVSMISVQNGNLTEILPCQYFYVTGKPEPESLSSIDKKFELKSLKSPAGIQYLLTARWYCNENTKLFRIKCVDRCPSIGTYLDNDTQVVSGALMNPTGHIGLVTLEEFQRQGLSLACLQKLTHILLTETTLIPCSMAYLKNEPSIQLHVKAKHTATHPCYFIFFKEK